jgi:hypothetical protein
VLWAEHASPLWSQPCPLDSGITLSPLPTLLHLMGWLLPFQHKHHNILTLNVSPSIGSSSFLFWQLIISLFGLIVPPTWSHHSCHFSSLVGFPLFTLPFLCHLVRPHSFLTQIWLSHSHLLFYHYSLICTTCGPGASGLSKFGNLHLHHLHVYSLVSGTREPNSPSLLHQICPPCIPIAAFLG